MLGTNDKSQYDEDILTLLHSLSCCVEWKRVGLSRRKWVPSSGSLVFFSPSLFTASIFSPPKPAERIGGAQGKWGPLYRLCEGGLGHAPRKFWDLHALNCFWGSFLCMHTVHTWLASCHLYLGISEKYDVRGALASGLCSSHVKIWNLHQQHKHKAKKQADLKSTIQQNKLFREAGLGCEWWTWSYLNKFGGPLHCRPRGNYPCFPPSVGGNHKVKSTWVLLCLAIEKLWEGHFCCIDPLIAIDFKWCHQTEPLWCHLA